MFGQVITRSKSRGSFSIYYFSQYFATSLLILYVIIAGLYMESKVVEALPTSIDVRPAYPLAKRWSMRFHGVGVCTLSSLGACLPTAIGSLISIWLAATVPPAKVEDSILPITNARSEQSKYESLLEEKHRSAYYESFHKLFPIEGSRRSEGGWSPLLLPDHMKRSTVLDYSNMYGRSYDSKHGGRRYGIKKLLDKNGSKRLDPDGGEIDAVAWDYSIEQTGNLNTLLTNMKDETDGNTDTFGENMGQYLFQAMDGRGQQHSALCVNWFQAHSGGRLQAGPIEFCREDQNCDEGAGPAEDICGDVYDDTTPDYLESPEFMEGYTVY